MSDLQSVIADSLRKCVREDGQGFTSVVGTIQHFSAKRGLEVPSNIDTIAAVVVVAVEEYVERHRAQDETDDAP